MFDDELVSCLMLSKVPGIGPIRFRALLTRFETASAVLAQPAGELLPLLGSNIASRVVDCQNRPGVRLQFERMLAGAGSLGIAAIGVTGDDYPALLRSIVDPPPVLWVKGPLPADQLRVAVVGTRRATPYGKKVAEWLSSGLASAGVEIVSGMAYGIDSAAHKGAIAASGRTTAVLGTSIESALGGHAASIAGLILDAGGALVSEHSAETVVLKGFFAARNRIVSGMSRATVVVEAPEKSGALITATCALDHGREVMAVPGTVFSATYAGCHALIRDGATLVRSSADVLLALGYGEARPPAPGDTVTVVPDDPDATAFASLGPDAKSFEDLLESTGLDPVVLATSLGMLEIRGLARRTAAGRFERTT